MSTILRPLVGLNLGLSISESDESALLGFPLWQVNRSILHTVAALFGQGVGVVFGHDWRDDGVMEAVHSFALQMQPPEPLSPREAESASQPLLRNILPWPDAPRLSAEDLERLASTLQVETAGLPEELVPHARTAKLYPEDSVLYTYVRARGLTHLRHRINQICQARFCLGGKRHGSRGRYPGVVEEALLTLRVNKPLYIAGMLGGAARQIIHALEGRPMPEDFWQTQNVTKAYATPPIIECEPYTREDRIIDAQGVWTEFQEAGINALTQFNGLSHDENCELFHTPVLDRVIQLLLVGLSRVSDSQATAK